MTHKSIDEIAVVILNYRAAKDTYSCVESVLNQNYLNFHIVIVENGSRDNSADELSKLQKKYPEKVSILYNDKNLGFAGGVNVGIRWSQKESYPYVALLNNDAITNKKWLGELFSVAQKNKDCGIVTGLMLRADGKAIDSTGEQYSTWGLAFPRDRNKQAATASQSGVVFGATGGASLYRLSMLREIGIFDEDFFAYYEDVDISFRAQLAGWKVYYQPTAIVYHEQGGTSSKMPGFTIYQTFKNLPLVYIKNVPAALLFSIGIRFYVAYWLMYFKAVSRGDFTPATKGLLQSMLYGVKALEKRWRIQRNKKVPSSYIRSILWHDLPPDQTGIRKLRRLFTGKP